MSLQDALGSVGNPTTLPYVKVQSPNQARGRRAAGQTDLFSGLKSGLQVIEAAQLDQDGPKVRTVYSGMVRCPCACYFAMLLRRYNCRRSLIC